MTNPRSSSHSSRSVALFDEMLVVAAQRGERRAGERLYRRWAPRLARAARRYCADGEAAQDIAQDCWAAIWKGLPGLRDPARFRSYAFAVLHRRGADHLRRIIRDRDALAERSDLELPNEVDPQSEQASEHAAITQAFGQLPPDQRLAAHLHFVEGLTLREIAEVQSIPEGTAKSRLFHARRKLKAALDPNQQGELQ